MNPAVLSNRLAPHLSHAVCRTGFGLGMPPYAITVMSTAARARTHTHTYTHTHTTHAHTHTRIHIHTQSHAHTRIRTHTRTHTHAVGSQVMDDYDIVFDKADPATGFAVVRERALGSSWLVRQVDAFGQAGGFGAIIGRLKNAASPPSVDVIETLCAVVAACAPLLARPFAVTFIPVFHEAALGSCLTMGDARLRDLKKDQLAAIGKSVRLVMLRTEPSTVVASVIEQFSISMALKLFASPFLQLKVGAIKIFSDAMSALRALNTAWLTRESLAKQLVAADVLTQLFRGHTELMKRAADIVKFLVMNKELTDAHIDLIWDASLTADDEATLLVHKVLDDVYYSMDARQLEYVLDKLAALPTARITTNTVNLVRRLSHAPGMATLAARGLSVLWVQGVEQELVAPEVADLARERMTDMLGAFSLRNQREPYLMMCVDSVVKGENVLRCLSLFLAIIETYYPSVSEPDTQASVLRRVEEKRSLLTVVVDSVQRFKEGAAARKMVTPAASGAGGASAALSSADDGKAAAASYVAELKSRLSFMTSVLTTSGLRLSQSHIDRLWDALERDAVVPAERELFFTWLGDGSKSNGTAWFDDTVAENIFSQRLGNVEADVTHMSVSELQLFLHYCSAINMRVGGLEVTTLDHGNSVCIPPQQLRGYEQLWRVAVLVIRPEVAALAGDLLNRLHTHMSVLMLPRAGEVCREYLSVCMRHVRSGAERGDHSHCARALGLVERLLRHAERTGLRDLKAHGARLRGRPVLVSVQNSIKLKIAPKAFDVKLFSNATVWDVREAVALKCQVTTASVRLFKGGVELRDLDNACSLGDLKFGAKEVVLASARGDSVHVPLLANPMAHASVARLSEAAAAALTAIFNRFCGTDGTMNREELLSYFGACGVPADAVGEERLRGIFASHDTNPSGAMTLPGFLQFYAEAAVSRETAVWNDLATHGYDGNLLLRDDSRTTSADVSEAPVLPHALLVADGAYFDLLFELLSSPPVAERAWALLQRLPTNPVLLASLSGTAAQPVDSVHWGDMLNMSSPFKFLYCLQIVASLVQQSGGDVSDAATATTTAPLSAVTERPLSWCDTFVMNGGLNHLFRTLAEWRTDAGGSDSGIGGALRSCLALILSLLQALIVTALSVERPALPGVVRLVRSNSDADAAIAAHAIAASVPSTTDGANGATTPDSPVVTGTAMDPDDDIFGDGVVEVVVVAAPAGATAEPAPGADRDPIAVLAVQQLSRVTVERVLKEVDFCVLQSKLLELLGSVSASSSATDEITVVQRALALWLATVMHDPSLLKVAHAAGGGKQFQLMLTALLFCPADAIRSEAEHTLHQLTRNIAVLPSPRETLIAAMVDMLPDEAAAAKGVLCGQYFDLLCKLLVDRNAAEAGVPDCARMVHLLHGRVRVHAPVERRSTAATVHDTFLAGALRTLATIYTIVPDACDTCACQHAEGTPSFLDVVWDNCLFHEAQTAEELDEGVRPALPLCKAAATRAAGYELLSSLAAGGHKCRRIVVERCARLLDACTRPDCFKFSTDRISKSATGYVGLRNLGCICYMNAMLQQLFMIPHFRYAILQAELESPDALVSELQRMFGYLIMSARQEYSTVAWCEAFTDAAGRPVNVKLQQDAEEWMNAFLDRLETKLKHTPLAGLVNSFFTGSVMYQTICQECGHISEREEQFHHIGLDVKNKTGIFDALDSFIAGERISGFSCSGCGRSVEITRRACLHRLPDTLFVHCKRICYNLDTYTNEKINSRWEFPRDLDVGKYTRAALKASEEVKGDEGDGAGGAVEGKDGTGDVEAVSPDKRVAVPADVPDSSYVLAGVLCHTGNATQGHYYSYIRDRARDGWYEFNDSTVRVFAADKLEQECFGGGSGADSEWPGVETEVRGGSMLVASAAMMCVLRLLCSVRGMRTCWCTSAAVRAPLRSLTRSLSWVRLVEARDLASRPTSPLRWRSRGLLRGCAICSPARRGARRCHGATFPLPCSRVPSLITAPCCGT